jgi:hypothetical protein
VAIYLITGVEPRTYTRRLKPETFFSLMPNTYSIELASYIAGDERATII